MEGLAFWSESGELEIAQREPQQNFSISGCQAIDFLLAVVSEALEVVFVAEDVLSFGERVLKQIFALKQLHTKN